MGSLFKRGEDVARFGSKAPWSIKYRTLDGRWRRERVSSEKVVARQKLAQIERQIERGEVGFVDPFAAHKRTPIAQHVAAFVEAMANGTLRHRHSGGFPTAKYVDQSHARLDRALAAMGVHTLGDVHAEGAERYLVHLRREGASAKTRDGYAMTLRQFGSWLARTERLPTNPWDSLHKIAGEADVTRERRALTLDEVDRLCAAAYERAVTNYLRSHPRAPVQEPERLVELRREGAHCALLYRFAALTGLRRGELRQIRWGDLDLDGNPPSVLVRAVVAKNRSSARVPLIPMLVELLRQEREGCRAGLADPVFRMSTRIVARMRLDLAFAGIAHLNELGQWVDFHSLRTTYATTLARAGVPPLITKNLMRHLDIKTTMRHYLRLDFGDLARGANLLDAFVGTRSGPHPKGTTQNGFGESSEPRRGKRP